MRFYLVRGHPARIDCKPAHPVQSTLLVRLWLAVLKSSYFGVYPALLSELFPAETRATGLAISYNIAVPVFGGFGPLVMEWLTQKLASPIAPSLWLTAVAILSLVSIAIVRRLYGIR